MGAELVRWEEDVAFTRFPEQMEGLRHGLSGAAGHQLEELSKVADVIENGLTEAEIRTEEPTVVHHTIVFDLPEGWNATLEREFEKINALIETGELESD